jgi:hypothetical protein
LAWPPFWASRGWRGEKATTDHEPDWDSRSGSHRTRHLAVEVQPRRREQADLLGSQIMARAGYDPLDLASMFETIQKPSQGGGSGPVFERIGRSIRLRDAC